MLYAAVALVQDKRLFGSAPKDIVLKYPTEDDLGGGLAVMSGIMYPFAKFIL